MQLLKSRRLIIILIGLALIFALGVMTSIAQEKAVYSMRPDQETTEGVVIGAEHRATNTLSWKGIPYAKPPVGELRWKAPQEPEKRSTPLKTVSFCEICPQYTDHDNNPATPAVIQGNENCLYLNIWRPKTRAANLPVYFWIHGGGNSIQWPCSRIRMRPPSPTSPTWSSSRSIIAWDRWASLVTQPFEQEEGR